MAELDYPIPFGRVTPRHLGLDKIEGGEVTVRTNGASELSKELVRSRAVEAVASTVAGLDGALASSFEFGLVIKW
ncbi:hypothetical protein WN990_33475 [Kitasatospora purpeofusca]|uniref:hypothetical protein n=1 Tax=Kitasatospora purpeofusca TaxID=67352 RepID=UPI0030F0B5B0